MLSKILSMIESYRAEKGIARKKISKIGSYLPCMYVVSLHISCFTYVPYVYIEVQFSNQVEPYVYL